MRTEKLNPGLLDRELIGRKIEKTGARFISLGNGFSHNLYDILTQTLLGRGINHLRIETDCLSDHEKRIMNWGNILTITDLDGVFNSPLMSVFYKNQRRISLDVFRFFKIIVQSSDQIWLLTSRLDPDKIRKRLPFLKGLIDLFQRKVINDFPFLDDASISRIEKFAYLFKQDKQGAAVLSEKSLDIQQRKEQFLRLIENFRQENAKDIVVYIIGSSLFDRRAVLRLCQENANLASKIVYIDTGHLIL